jgi:glycosyltransferase involved in cell wall biosynthesis
MRLAIDARKLTDYGIGTYLTHLLRGLTSRSEIDLTVLARHGHEERVDALAPGAKIITVGAGGYSLNEQWQVPLALWREPLDLLHVPHYVIPLASRVPVVSTIHDIIQLFYPPSRRTGQALLYLRAMIRLTLRRSRHVITVSRASRRDLVRIFGADRARLSVVANGVDEELAHRPGEAILTNLKKRLGLKPPLLLAVGNDKPHKNLDTVLRVFHLAVRRHQIPGQLVFVGGVERNGAIRRKADHLGLGQRVRIVGRVSTEELHGLYHASSVLVHLALYEGFGYPILEAMHAGLPVVTSNLGAMQELGEGAALLVNPLDVQEGASALDQVLVDDPLRRRMTDAGRRRAGRLTWKRMIDGTVDAYTRALGAQSTEDAA